MSPVAQFVIFLSEYMSQDLEEYQNIIEELKPMINEPEFNQVLSQVAATVPKQKRFLLKMELKRLARPCIRLIDLRGLVDGKCRLYTHETRQHFLDDVAIETFEKQLRTLCLREFPCGTGSWVH